MNNVHNHNLKSRILDVQTQTNKLVSLWLRDISYEFQEIHAKGLGIFLNYFRNINIDLNLKKK